jgi:hypothetical protein
MADREFNWEVTRSRRVVACGYAMGLEAACTLCRASHLDLLDLYPNEAAEIRGTVSEADEEIWTTDDDEE